MAGWYSRASRSIRDALGRYSSKSGAYRSSNLRISQNLVNHLNNNALGKGKMEGMLENMQRDSPFVDPRKVGLFKLWFHKWRSGQSKTTLPHLMISWPIFARYFGGDVIDAVYRRIGTAHYTGRRRYLMLTSSHEKEKGDEVNKSKFKWKIVAPHHPYCIKVQKIGREIVEVAKSQAAHAKEFEWEFFVIDDPTTVNSFTLPGGKVFVYSGFLEKFGKDDEIAAVIAHEVGHNVAGHLAEHLTEAGILHFVLGLRLPAFYNPRWELEADYIGLILMASAGYDPRVVPPMLRTQDDHTDHRGSHVMMGTGGADDFPMEDLSEEARALLLQDIPGETRAQQLLQPEVMEKALSISDAELRSDNRFWFRSARLVCLP